jgi:hypothetical protein
VYIEWVRQLLVDINKNEDYLAELDNHSELFCLIIIMKKAKPFTKIIH